MAKVLESAKKHGLSEQEIRDALENIVCSKKRYKEAGKAVCLAVGILPNGRTCELAFFINQFGDPVVFHAMSPARNSFVKDVQAVKKRG